MDVGQPKDFLTGTTLYLNHVRHTHPEHLTAPADKRFTGNVLLHPTYALVHWLHLVDVGLLRSFISTIVQSFYVDVFPQSYSSRGSTGGSECGARTEYGSRKRSTPCQHNRFGYELLCLDKDAYF